MFRAQFGGGIGIGADIKIPGLIHTGLSAGQYMNVGIRYDDPELSHDASATLVAWHWEGRESRRPEGPKEHTLPLGRGRTLLGEHSCWAVLPPLTTTNDKDGLSVWDFEIGIMLLVLDFRIGFNPLRLDRPDKRPRQPTTAPPPREARPPSTELDASAPAKPSRSGGLRPTYERDPLLPAVDPPPDRGSGD
ncbi:hypothetical protein HY251_15225 [bacterium]|nr:hypothetical protein [bacterium]